KRREDTLRSELRSDWQASACPTREARDWEVYGRHRHTGDCTAGGTGVREQRTGEDGAGAQGRVAGGTEAPGATGAPVERTGGREQAQPQDGGGSGAEFDVARRTAAFGSRQDRSCVQSGAGRDRADRGRAASSPQRGRRNAVEGIPDRLRERESGVSPGADCRGHGDDGHPESSGGRPGDGGPGADTPRDERRGNAAGTRGNRARGVADPEGAVKRTMAGQECPRRGCSERTNLLRERTNGSNYFE